MLIENDFTVDAAPDAVYDLMLDVERVATCLPGTEVLGRRDDGGYDGQMSLKLGPMKMKYKGSVAIAEQDAAARTATMVAKGVEAKGQGSAQGTMKMAVTDSEGGGSLVSVSTKLQITGRVAQMGHGIMKDVSTKMIGEMASNMERLLAADAAEPAPVAAEPPGRPIAGEPATVPPPDPSPAAPRATHVRLGTVVAAVLRGRLAALRAWARARRHRHA